LRFWTDQGGPGRAVLRALRDGRNFRKNLTGSGGLASSSQGLHSGYTFPLLNARHLGPAFVREHYEMLARISRSLAVGRILQHDVVRTVTRFGGRDAPPALARLMLALLVSLKGTPILYQGEELGLPETELRRRPGSRTPWAILYLSLSRGRDGCRTPMPWDRLVSQSRLHHRGRPGCPCRRRIAIGRLEPGARRGLDALLCASVACGTESHRCVATRRNSIPRCIRTGSPHFCAFTPMSEFSVCLI